MAADPAALLDCRVIVRSVPLRRVFVGTFTSLDWEGGILLKDVDEIRLMMHDYSVPLTDEIVEGYLKGEEEGEDAGSKSGARKPYKLTRYVPQVLVEKDNISNIYIEEDHYKEALAGFADAKIKDEAGVD